MGSGVQMSMLQPSRLFVQLELKTKVTAEVGIVKWDKELP